VPRSTRWLPRRILCIVGSFWCGKFWCGKLWPGGVLLGGVRSGEVSYGTVRCVSGEAWYDQVRFGRAVKQLY